MHGVTRMAPRCDLVQHGFKAVADVLLMPHLRATTLDVTKSGAHVCEEKYVRITKAFTQGSPVLLRVA